MKRLLRFLFFLGFFLGAVAGLAAVAARVRERLATPVPLGHPAPETGDAAPVPAAAPPGDDLTAVRGIGPVYHSRLAETGITTFAALASADPAAVVAATGVPPERAADWIARAADLGSP
ncbi:MAG: helix-hairpin-helix domain-containing protein [Actinomycetota bacterium]